MEELKRLKRTLAKAQEGAPHEVLLVVERDHRPERDPAGAAVPRGARRHRIRPHQAGRHGQGGVIIGICDALKIPVRYVGVGEKVSDLKEFDAHSSSSRSSRASPANESWAANASTFESKKRSS